MDEKPVGRPPGLTVARRACSLSGAMRMLASPVAVALLSGPVLALTLIACLPLDNTGTSSGSASSTGGSSGSTADGGEGGANTTAGLACLDTATAFATAAKRCGGDYDAERAAFIRDLANGDCNLVSIRNETELRSRCIPSFSTISCADLTNQRFAPSCAEQIIRSK